MSNIHPFLLTFSYIFSIFKNEIIKKLIGGLEKRFVLTSILAPLAITVEVILGF